VVYACKEIVYPGDVVQYAGNVVRAKTTYVNLSLV